jgi:drug/metabolite transporter (DMT)-like permease
MLLATVLLWALNFTVTKYVLTHGFRPLAYSVVRYGAATLLFSALTFARERSFRVHRSGSLLLLAAAAFVLWLNQVSYVYAIKFTTASTVALILGTTPIFTAVFARIARMEQLSRAFWLAALLSFAGAAMIALGEKGGVSANIKGDLLAVGTAASWAAYTIAIAPLMRDYSPYRISAIVLVGCWLLLAATGGYQIPGQRLDLGWLTWLAFAYAVVGPLVITNVLWFTSIDRVGPSRASLFANLQPFFAAIFAVILLSEHMTAIQVGGGVLIAAGIVLERRSHMPVPPPGAGIEREPVGSFKE